MKGLKSQTNKRKTHKQRNKRKKVIKRKQRNKRNHTRKHSRKHTRKQKNKRRKSMKGGSWPFSGMGNLFSMGAYQAENAMTPLSGRTVDNVLTNPNYSSQFPVPPNDPNLVTGPKLSVE
jgi:phosphate/sulfate permease